MNKDDYRPPMSDQMLAIREAAESDLATFIKLVHPLTVLGAVHEDCISWWERPTAKDQQLVLLPRDHQKSRLLAYRVIRHLVLYPDHRVLYLSSTSGLAEKQLKFMKDILESNIFRRYWPEYVHKQEDKREKWTATEVSIDHPLRKIEGVRDPSIITGGLTTSITGLHCDVAALDDVVVQENAYTRDGRDKVKTQYSLLSSIESGEAKEWVVGTRYDPRDLYNDMMEMQEEIFDANGEVVGTEPVYEKFEKQVEDSGIGTGEFLWPRQQRYDGKWFGFDQRILARKRAKYLNRTQYYAQYYNNPNNPEGSGVSKEYFQYYDKAFLKQEMGNWHYQNKRLNVVAAIDFAFSLTKKADFTALVVVGIDSDGFIYVLDIDRFKTDNITDYFNTILRSHVKWGYRKLRVETVAAQKMIVEELKRSYIRPNGLALALDSHSPNRASGAKEERIAAMLNPRYENNSIWHYRGGNCSLLEDELVVERPPHDDIKDALTAAVEIAVPPSNMGASANRRHKEKIKYHSRFGGVAA